MAKTSKTMDISKAPEEGLKTIDNMKRRQDYKKRVKRLRRIVGLILILSFIIFIVIAALAVAQEGLDKFEDTLDSINIFYYILALVTIFVAYAMRFPKWELYMKKLGVRIDRKKNFVIYLSMYSMDITPGRWGRAIVSYTINEMTKIKFAHTFPAIVADIFTDYLGFAVIAIVSAFLVVGYFAFSIVLSFILMIPFVFIYSKRFFLYVKRKLSRFKRLHSIFDVGDIYFESNKLLDRNVYIQSMIYTIPSMFLNGLALWFVMLGFGLHVGLVWIPTILFVYSTSLIFGMITGIPATLGVTDAVLLSYMTIFFPGLGITFGIASAITILFRFASVWFVQAFGFAALTYTFRYWSPA